MFFICLFALVAAFLFFGRFFGGWFGDAVLGTRYQAASAVGYILTPFRYVGGLLNDRADLEDDLARLQKENLALRAMRARDDAARAAFGAEGSDDSSSVRARVAGKGAHLFGQQIIIDRGALHGIAPGDIVISESRTLVGRVIGASSRYASVQLVSDKDFRAAVRILPLAISDAAPESDDPWQLAVTGVPSGARASAASEVRTFAEGLLEGEGFGSVRIGMIPSGSYVNEGDTVVTSGFDNLFPPGLLAGSILGIISGPADLLQEAVVEPAVDVGALESVAVISMHKK